MDRNGGPIQYVCISGSARAIIILSVPKAGSFSNDACTIRLYNSADGNRYLSIDQSNSLTWHQLKRRVISDSLNLR